MATSQVAVAETTPSADGESPNQLDGLLLSALANPRDRLTILKLDYELERFIRESRQTRLEFPPMSSYQRLIVHRVAQYFRLDHAVFEMDGTKRSIVLFKTPKSKIPALRFTDLVEQEEAPSQSVKIMKRAGNGKLASPASPAMNQAPPTATILGKTEAKSEGGAEHPLENGTINNSKTTETEAQVSPEAASVDRVGKTLEEREADYAKARARIFNDAQMQQADGVSPSPSPSSVSAPAPMPSPSLSSPPPSSAAAMAVRTTSPSASPSAATFSPLPPAATASSTTPPSATAPIAGAALASSSAPPKEQMNRSRQGKPQPPPVMYPHMVPPPHWDGNGNEYVLEHGVPDLHAYFAATGGPPPGSLWGDTFFYSPDPQAAFARSAPFPPPQGGVSGVPRPFVPDPRTPLPYAAVAAGKGLKGAPMPMPMPMPMTPGGPLPLPTPVVVPNGREPAGTPSPPLPLPLPVPHHPPHAPPGDENASVLGFYAPADKLPESVYGPPPMGYQGYAPLPPWPVYAPFPAYPYAPPYGPPLISASVDYDRRPPSRSMELFDPKAPAQPHRRPQSGGQQMMYAPYQPQLYDPTAGTPLRQQVPSPAIARAGSNGSLGARPVRADKPPARVASKPYFDYSQPTTSDGASAPPPVPNHILEVFNISPSVKLDEPGDAFADIKGAGSSVKMLGGGAVVAIFKTSVAAKAALARLKSPLWELRQWTPVVAPMPPEAIDGGERAKSPALP